MLADEGAAAESPIKKRRAADTTPASAGRRAVSHVVQTGMVASKGQPVPRHPSAYAVPAAAPKGRVFAINGFQAAATKRAHDSSPTAAPQNGRSSSGVVPPAALESTYVRMRLDALLSSI